MGLENCQIQLDNPYNTYYTGQTLNGQVKLNLQKEKKVRGKLVNFHSFRTAYINVMICMNIK